MSIAVLLAEPNSDFAASIKENLSKNSISTEIVQDGKDWHSKVREKTFSFIVLNYSLHNETYQDMLKHLNQDHGETIIFLAIKDSERPGVDQGILKHKSVAQILPFPYSVEQLLKYINDFTATASEKRSPLHTKINALKSLTHKILTEVYARGLNEQHIEYAQQIGTSVIALIQKDKEFITFLQEYDDYDTPLTTHPFLVMLFSLLICKKLQWQSVRTVNAIALAAILHDIGMGALPDEVRRLPPEDMTKEQFEIFQRHCILGAEILHDFPKISAPVIQIVLQHHEKNGKGFPNQLSDAKIYPLAKVVCLADHFVRILLKGQLTPIKGLKSFMSDRSEIIQYDHDLIKALIKCFVRDDKEESREK